MKVDVFSVGDEGEQTREGRQVDPTNVAVEIVPEQPLGIIERAQIDMQIATAKQFPRSVSDSMSRAKDLACYSPLIASACTYAKPQGNKKVKGPSIRLAEIMATSWGNLRYGGRVLSVGERVITCQGVCHDLETNVSVSVEVTRSIIDKDKHRYSDSMIVTTSMAGIAIGIRNAIFKVIPGAFVAEIQDSAKKVARGEDQGLAARLESALGYFESLGVSHVRVFLTLGIKGPEEVTWEHIDTLLGYATSIRVEEVPVEDIFPTKTATAPPGKPEKPAPEAPEPPKTEEPKTEEPEKTQEQPEPAVQEQPEPKTETVVEPEVTEEKKTLIPESNSSTKPEEGTPPEKLSYTQAAYVLGQHGASWAAIYEALELGEHKDPTEVDKNKVIAWAVRVTAGEALETVMGVKTEQVAPGPPEGEALFGKKKADAEADAAEEDAGTVATGAQQLDF